MPSLHRVSSDALMKSLMVYFLTGESGQVYKAYLNTELGKEIVAVKTGKGKFKIIGHITVHLL